MNDVCIKLLSKYPTWSPEYNNDIQRYKTWIKQNMQPNTYYIPPRREPVVFFLEEEDLVIFTIQFGRDCFKIVGNVIDMSNIERMILNEIAKERNEKSQNRR